MGIEGGEEHNETHHIDSLASLVGWSEWRGKKKGAR